MRSRQTPYELPRIWLMTDERFGDELVATIARLPRGSGVIFRHYSLAIGERRCLFGKVRKECRKHDHLILLAGEPLLARLWAADGYHGPHRNKGGMLHSMSVHNMRELLHARQMDADMIFISPVFATASHPGTPKLGAAGFRRLAIRAGYMKSIALGGMDAERARTLGRAAYGWAAIDAFRNLR